MDSKSASDFKIELPNTVQMSENTVFFVSGVCVPHVWKTVEEGFNDSLVLSYIVPGVGGSFIENFFVVVLAEGNHTLPELATHLQTKLNAIRESTDVSQIIFNVSNDLKDQTLTISITASNPNVCFKLYTDAEVIREIRNYWTTVNPRATCDLRATSPHTSSLW